MFIDCFKNNGTDYLRLVESRRILDRTGKKTPRKQTVLNIGPLSNYDDGKPEYLTRLRESFRNGTPLIESLLPFVGKPRLKTHTLSFTDGMPECIAHPKIFSHVLLDRVFQSLGLASLCAALKHELGLKYDIAGFLRLLLFGRILNPASKISTSLQNETTLLFYSNNGFN